MEWHLMTEEEVQDQEAHRCGAMRARTRPGKITCEGDVRHHMTDRLTGKLLHCGRNDRGAWYLWP
jgi:hypothetical protein